MEPLLSVENLNVRFHTLRGAVHALNGVSFHINREEILGIAGESGCGKSVTSRAILRLIESPGRIEGGSIHFEGRDILGMSTAEIRQMRGKEISMIMQEPKMSLNPVMRVGYQVAETLLIHNPSLTRQSAREQAADMLTEVGIPDAGSMAQRYPHQLSGGMAQRVMIAMMLVTRPKLLIADEPTSALDVTIQAQILDLFKGLIKDVRTSVLMITHDLGVMAETCDRIAVMYAGNMVEIGSVRDVLKSPSHPYTRSLLKTVPDNANPDTPLLSIRGNVPSLLEPQNSCMFAPRCDHATDRCQHEKPGMYDLQEGHKVACFLRG